MISETLEHITRGGLLVFLWMFVILMWCITYYLIKENARFSNERIDYALAGLGVVVMGGVTFYLLMVTLSAMGV